MTFFSSNFIGLLYGLIHFGSNHDGWSEKTSFLSDEILKESI